MGIWPPGADLTDVNAVARSHKLGPGDGGGADNRLLLAADDRGLLKLFNWPAVVNQVRSGRRVR